MKVLHIVNCLAWLANAVVWQVYAHSMAMTITALAAAALAAYMWTLES